MSGSSLKVESATLVFLVLCIFLSFYFTYLSFQTLDDTFKKQLVILAACSLVTGIVILACMTIYLGMKKAFPSIEEQLTDTEESTETHES